MRKVGIMSMQRIANYGSFLQAYALKQLIEELSCKVEFVDYHVGAPVIAENADSKNKFVRKVEKGLETFQYQAPFAHKLSFIRYKQTFSKKYMPLLGITDEMNYNPTLDCLVIGSDEVFNCIQKNSNVGYSLELFGKDNHAKRLLTYAASFGNTTLEKLEKYKKADEVGVLLKKFDAISVRDANSGAIVERLTEKKPVYNLDPVLTYDYMNCCDKIPQLRVDEKYLILYAYGKHFMDGDCYRESCYKCAYANTSRVGDLTVGDFWGIAKSHPSFNSPKGVSSVLTKTEVSTNSGNYVARTDEIAFYTAQVKNPILGRGYISPKSAGGEEFDTKYGYFSLTDIGVIGLYTMNGLMGIVWFGIIAIVLIRRTRHCPYKIYGIEYVIYSMTVCMTLLNFYYSSEYLVITLILLADEFREIQFLKKGNQ